ncbi:GtrA family protein [Pseudobutyrivibrio ruminis]|uniref:GtrA family protein n=1 Tax=Pseudobutyrivibrio ruminis TaxID=46206 RepID=UPI000411D341|nr:GtrA family protein [Pseudobutyrivibrio ruminis]
MKKIKDLYFAHEEIINYLVVGVLTTIVSWIAYGLCRFVLDVNGNQLHMQLAVLIRWIAGVLFAYFTNRKFVFKSTNPNKIKEFASFTSSRVVTYFLDALIMAFLPGFLPAVICGLSRDWVATLVSAVVVTVTNYILSKFLVFAKTKKL